MSHNIPFTKMHGLGNDYIYINTIDNPISHPENMLNYGATPIPVSAQMG